MSNTKPVVISCGEPAGVGPEVAAAAWLAVRDTVPLVWVGDPRHLPEGTIYQKISSVPEAAGISRSALPVLEHAFDAPSIAGQPDARNAQGVIDVIMRCVDLVTAGDAAALCTAPIHKKALMDGAGFAYPGHTEFLQALARDEGRAVMMIASDALKVVPATIHIALEDVPKALTPDVLRDTIRITNDEMKHRFGVPTPRIAVAGLNPHAGEGGAMGRQELEWIDAVLDEMRGEGITLLGPLPADTMFHARARQTYDVAIGMYHDQVLIPVKTLDFDRGVNVTLGLPFVRTSPDHGTAFDIAGQGIANPQSMIEAIRLAARMAGTGFGANTR